MVKADILATALTRALESGENPQVIAKRFVEFLRAHRLLGMADAVLARLARQRARQNQFNTLVLESAHPISKSAAEEIRKLLKADTTAPLTITVNPALLAGFRARYQDRQYEGSFEEAVNELAQTLIH